MVGDQLGAEVNVGLDAYYWVDLVNFVGFKTKREEGLPCVLEGFTHRALYAAIIKADDCLHVLILGVELSISGLVLLETVEMEGMTAFCKSDACLVLRINDILKLQRINHSGIPLPAGVIIFFFFIFFFVILGSLLTTVSFLLFLHLTVLPIISLSVSQILQALFLTIDCVKIGVIEQLA